MKAIIAVVSCMLFCTSATGQLLDLNACLLSPTEQASLLNIINIAANNVTIENTLDDLAHKIRSSLQDTNPGMCFAVLVAEGATLALHRDNVKSNYECSIFGVPIQALNIKVSITVMALNVTTCDDLHHTNGGTPEFQDPEGCWINGLHDPTISQAVFMNLTGALLNCSSLQCILHDMSSYMDTQTSQEFCWDSFSFLDDGYTWGYTVPTSEYYCVFDDVVYPGLFQGGGPGGLNLFFIGRRCTKSPVVPTLHPHSAPTFLEVHDCILSPTDQVTLVDLVMKDAMKMNETNTLDDLSTMLQTDLAAKFPGTCFSVWAAESLFVQLSANNVKNNYECTIPGVSIPKMGLKASVTVKALDVTSCNSIKHTAGQFTSTQDPEGCYINGQPNTAISSGVFKSIIFAMETCSSVQCILRSVQEYLDHFDGEYCWDDVVMVDDGFFWGYTTAQSNFFCSFDDVLYPGGAGGSLDMFFIARNCSTPPPPKPSVSIAPPILDTSDCLLNATMQLSLLNVIQNAVNNIMANNTLDDLADAIKTSLQSMTNSLSTCYNVYVAEGSVVSLSGYNAESNYVCTIPGVIVTPLGVKVSVTVKAIESYMCQSFPHTYTDGGSYQDPEGCFINGVHDAAISQSVFMALINTFQTCSSLQCVLSEITNYMDSQTSNQFCWDNSLFLDDGYIWGYNVAQSDHYCVFDDVVYPGLYPGGGPGGANVFLIARSCGRPLTTPSPAPMSNSLDLSACLVPPQNQTYFVNDIIVNYVNQMTANSTLQDLAQQINRDLEGFGGCWDVIVAESAVVSLNKDTVVDNNICTVLGVSIPPLGIKVSVTAKQLSNSNCQTISHTAGQFEQDPEGCFVGGVSNQTMTKYFLNTILGTLTTCSSLKCILNSVSTDLDVGTGKAYYWDNYILQDDGYTWGYVMAANDFYCVFDDIVYPGAFTGGLNMFFVGKLINPLPTSTSTSSSTSSSTINTTTTKVTPPKTTTTPTKAASIGFLSKSVALLCVTLGILVPWH